MELRIGWQPVLRSPAGNAELPEFTRALEALTWQRLLWQKQLENVLRLKHRQINITRVDTNDLHFEMPEAHTAS